MQTLTPESEASPEAERERQLSFRVGFSSFGTKPAARATIDRVQKMLEVELHRPVEVTARRYG